MISPRHGGNGCNGFVVKALPRNASMSNVLSPRQTNEPVDLPMKLAIEDRGDIRRMALPIRRSLWSSENAWPRNVKNASQVKGGWGIGESCGINGEELGLGIDFWGKTAGVKPQELGLGILPLSLQQRSRGSTCAESREEDLRILLSLSSSAWLQQLLVKFIFDVPNLEDGPDWTKALRSCLFQVLMSFDEVLDFLVTSPGASESTCSKLVLGWNVGVHIQCKTNLHENDQ
eukprot:s458_g14.t1